MTQVGERKLEMDRVVPGFALPSLDGKQVGPGDYKQKANLVIAYLDLDRCGACKDFLRSLSDNYHLYRADETEILAVCPQPVDELRGQVGAVGLPFPVLSDEKGAVRGIYFSGEPGQPVAGVFITDRYGALRNQMISQNSGDIPAQQDILDWLDLIEMECPECGT